MEINGAGLNFKNAIAFIFGLIILMLMVFAVYRAKSVTDDAGRAALQFLKHNETIKKEFGENVDIKRGFIETLRSMNTSLKTGTAKCIMRASFTYYLKSKGRNGTVKIVVVKNATPDWNVEWADLYVNATFVVTLIDASAGKLRFN